MRGSRPVKWIDRVSVGARELKVARVSVPRWSARTVRDGGTYAIATHEGTQGGRYR